MLSLNEIFLVSIVHVISIIAYIKRLFAIKFYGHEILEAKKNSDRGKQGRAWGNKNIFKDGLLCILF